MFGLLKTRKLTNDQNIDFRLNYCGTCKAIGKIYGHKERLLLNYDVVFLSELLHSLNNEPEVFNSITPYACLNLPNHLEDIPKFLKYTASVNIILGYYKLMDNVIDSSFKINIWRFLKSSLHSKYIRAKKTLEEFGLDVSLVETQIQEQFEIERNKFVPDSFDKIIEYYSNPTGRITGEIFSFGVVNLGDENLTKQMYIIGENFGKIVYLIDAIEDCEKDRIKNEFNIFLIDNKFEKAKALEETKAVIDDKLTKLENSINVLPITETQKKRFISRIFLNVNEKLNNYTIQKIESCQFRPNISERFNLALEVSKRKSLNKSNTFLRYSQFALMAFILIISFILFPGTIHASKGYLQADCCGSCGGCCDNTCAPGCCGQDGCGCRKLGEEEGKIFNCSTCLFALICCPCICGLFSGGGGGDGKIITITKIIPIDKGCGGCG